MAITQRREHTFKPRPRSDLSETMKKIAPRRAMREIEELLTLQRRLDQSIPSNPGHVVYMDTLEC